jgi:EAL domain-containing protein (putative c-di-GMP-specific phosphodiesterase class I)
LERSEFSLHYQPQIDIRDGRIVGFEAMLRWDTPTRGSVSPAKFIAILEETGLIIPVGEWVLHQACRWAAGLSVDGQQQPPQIAVNLSSRQFRHPGLFQSIADALAQSGLAPERLELEITESGLVDVEAHGQTMDQLKRLGVQLGIDDFGTGYSSLSYLKRFPVDRLKIDASFVRDVPGDPEDAAIVRTIIGLGHNLGLQVIAEGVETPEQLQFLADNDCDEIQGYLVARPLPGSAIVNWVNDWRPHRWRASALAPPTARAVDG